MPNSYDYEHEQFMIFVECKGHPNRFGLDQVFDSLASIVEALDLINASVFADKREYKDFNVIIFDRINGKQIPIKYMEDASIYVLSV